MEQIERVMNKLYEDNALGNMDTERYEQLSTKYAEEYYTLKEEKEEIIGDKAIEIEKGKKSKEDKKDKLTEDFLNNLETTMREGK